MCRICMLLLGAESAPLLKNCTLEKLHLLLQLPPPARVSSSLLDSSQPLEVKEVAVVFPVKIVVLSYRVR